MGKLVNGVVNILANLQVTLAPARKLVVEGVCQRRQLFLGRKVVRDATHLLCRAVIEKLPHLLPDTNSPQFLPQSDVVREMLLKLIPLRIAIRTINWPLRLRMGLCLIHEICHPSRDRLNQYLRSLTFEEVEHMEVAVPLSDLGPELARDLDRWLHARAVHFNRIHSFARGRKSVEIILAPHVLVPLAKHVKRVAKNLVALDL